MYDYFQKTPLDEAFYAQYIHNRLPERILDAHAHYNLPEHVKNVSAAAIREDWALECGLLMSFEDACSYYEILLPETQVDKIALPWPLREADTHGNNAYVSLLAKKPDVRALMTIRPEYGADSIERAFAEGGFSGFKPYPYMASEAKRAEVSVFDFMTHAQFALANKLHAPVLLHLPRAGRMADPANIADIRAILDRYPNVKLVVAHFGRCFNAEYFERSLERLGQDVHRFWFDTAAVINPAVYKLAFGELDYHKILFGTDFPILLWHGKREWANGTYVNLCREDFSWNTHPHAADEPNYTFFVYEQLKVILDSIGGDAQITQAVFCGNAKSVYYDYPQGGARA